MIFWTTVIGQRIDEAENTRSMLICAEMSRRGHEVIMWTSAYDHIRKEWRREYIENPEFYIHPEFGFKIKFFKGCGYKTNMSFRRFFDHWLGARDFIKKARKLPKPDVILTSIPDHFTASKASVFGNENNIPVIIDIRDKWPDIFSGMLSNQLAANFLDVCLFFERRRIKKGLYKAFSIVAMMDSLLDWGLDGAKREKTSRDRLFYLTPFENNFSTAKFNLSDLNKNVQTLFQKVEGKIVFSYIGTFNRSQHPSLLLEAIAHLAQNNNLNPNQVEFVIGGHGLDAESIERECERFPNVTYLGWLNTKNMLAVLAKSDVGLLLLKYPFPALNNKCFAYMASGLAMINSASGPINKLIEVHKFGININANSPIELADSIIKLSNNSKMLKEMQENARNLFIHSFDRATNYSNYASHIEYVVDDFRMNKK